MYEMTAYNEVYPEKLIVVQRVWKS